MSTDIGFDASTPSLPTAGGAVSGLGETFTPDLSTGGATLTIPLDLPNGPGDIGPHLQLRYDTGQGAGPFGLGFMLPTPRLVRSLTSGFPRYDDTDTIALEGAGDLVSLGNGQYRPQVDGGVWRVAASGEGFICLDRQGNSYTLGTTAAGRLTDGPAGTRTFAWHLEQVADPLGNTAGFSWMADGSQLYLASVSYGPYQVTFDYEQRPDVLRWGRPGFLITTALRCSRISLLLTGDARPAVRTWTLGYQQHPSNNSSLLSTVTLTGHDADGTELAAPPLSLTYSQLGEPTLTRFAAEPPAPPALDAPSARIDLTDWNGDGLPDLVDLTSSGQVRLWPNLGGCRWGTPRAVAEVPALARSGPVALADINGDGAADLIAAALPLSGYVPRIPGGAFGLPVKLAQAPSPLPAAPSARLVDLDGDGAVDLLTSDGTNLALYYQDGQSGGWQSPPQVVGRQTAPVGNLADPHVFLADMTGDGLADLVRVDGGGVTYWPYLGMGRWAPAVQMTGAPQLGFDVDPARLFLEDIDGDGVADLLQLDDETVRVWINQAGNGFGAPQEIQAVPTARMNRVRVADMTGTGAAGVLWSMSSRPGVAAHFFLDITGGAKPYLLSGTDNGVGLTTAISYSTSAQEAARDANAGQPWASQLPVVLPVVAQLDATDQATGLVSSQTFRYSQGRWDGVLREFAGYGTVAQTDVGDDIAPTLRTVFTFATGTDPASGMEPATMADRLRWRAIRGRLLEKATFGPDGSPAATNPFAVTTQQWRVDVDGQAFVPRLTEQVQATYERQAAPAGLLTTTNVSFDANGNITDSVQSTSNPTDPSQTFSLRTVTSYATDAAGRFPAKPWRVTQTDALGTVVADTVIVYDDQPEGSVGAQGLVTSRSALALTSAMVAAAYQAPAPDFASLGYHQRSGEDGWWVWLGRYDRTDGAAGLSGSVTGPLGGVTQFSFDTTRMFPVSITDPAGNVIQAAYDYRTCRAASLTDASGEAYQAAFDPLSRLVAVIEPGDSAALPTRSLEYDANSVPVTCAVHQLAVSGQPGTIDSRSRFDGAGRLLESRVRDETGEVVLEARTYCARGFLASQYQPVRAAGPAYSPPQPADPHIKLGYDALGRQVLTINADGSTRTISYGPLVITEADEEDNRAGGEHQNTPVRRYIDPAGRVVRVELDLAGRSIASSYTYNVKGELVSHVDALGNQTQLWHDCLGHTIRVDRPESSIRSVFDAPGNPAQAYSATELLAVRDFDVLNRPVSVRLGSAAATPAIQYTYHDTAAPPPPDAGAHTLGGRLVRIDDEGGTTILDYDNRGHVAKKASTPAGSSTTYEIDSTYRADGQIASITYPGSANRLKLAYSYDARGQITSVPGVVTSIGRDLAGRRTSLSYANGAEHTFGYDPLTMRLAGMNLSSPGAGGTIRTLSYDYDLAGNLLSVASPEPDLAASYGFDDLYRLTTATAGDGSNWNYGYNDAGMLTTKSDVGAYSYGQNGAPATCLTTAGAATFSYTGTGDMAATPWGTQTFDQLGRLVAIDGGGQAATFSYDHAGMRVLASTGAHTRITPDALYAVEDGTLTLHLFDGVGVAARRLQSGQTQYLHADHLGSLAVVTDDTGAVTATLRYDPFGAVIGQSGSGGREPFGFIGGTPDSATGLLYLNARWYAPAYGVFVSPDPVVQNVYDPLCWAAYAYCRNNPVTYVDPSGRSFLGIFLAALAIVALIVVVVLAIAADVISFGTLTPGVVIGVIAVGMLVGGIVGGLAAAKRGGSTEDIVEGVLVGAAVGGWAAFASIAGGAGLGGSAASLLHAGGLWGAVIAGGVNGAVSGAAMGFATGFAGGKGTLDDVLNNMWQGAVVGLLAGAALGAASYMLKPPGDFTTTMGQKLQPQAGAGQMPNPGGGPTAAVAPYSTNSLAPAGQYVGQGMAGKALGAAGMWLLQLVLTGPAAPVAETLLVDAASGAWDLYGIKLLYSVGVQGTSGSW